MPEFVTVTEAKRHEVKELPKLGLKSGDVVAIDRVFATLLYEVHVDIQMDGELADESIAHCPVFTKRPCGMATSSVRFTTSATG